MVSMLSMAISGVVRTEEFRGFMVGVGG